MSFKCRYQADVLRANATRYPWSLRTHAAGGASEAAALQQRYARMCAASHNGKQGDQRQTYMPMLLGLWDAVGVVHELNGYRHDVVGAMGAGQSRGQGRKDVTAWRATPSPCPYAQAIPREWVCFQ
ncbi:hypothetical protein V2H26_17935 [Xanthomonas euvesicatoria]|nr:hypothetical protein [Xanthomonas axonopodis]MEE5091859.1 hypothetical protein [Xanthomonas euvesicatoria]